MINDNNERPIYSIEDDDDDAPLYALDTDDDKAPDSLPDAEDAEMDEDDEEEETVVGEDNLAAVKAPSPFGVMLKTMLTPVEGWKKLKRARFKTEEMARRCFYPLIALAAFSNAAKLFYEANVTAAAWAVSGLVTFISFFFGYFTVLLCGEFVLPRRSRDFLKKEIGRQFVMLCLSTLAIFRAMMIVLPMFEPVLVFLPLWTIYLIYKGIRVIKVPSEVENSTTGIMCMLIIGVPLLWSWICTEILMPAAM